MRLYNERHCPVIKDITPSGFITIAICCQVKFMSKFGIEVPGTCLLYKTFSANHFIADNTSQKLHYRQG